MENKISFKNIDVSTGGTIRCNVTRDATDELYIELPYSYRPSDDLIVAALASLCGTSFDLIEIDLPIGPAQKQALESLTRAKIISKSGNDLRRKPGQRNALNFSGGFDSLAAKAVLGDVDLISLDFGGRFSRERIFFERFNPLVFKTNLTDLKLNSYSWQFMGIGSILLRDELDLEYYSFGSILAGSFPRLFTGPVDQSKFGVGSANALGMRQSNPVAGLTEIATLSIAAKTFPMLMVDALMSVALPGEDKFMRKHQMIQAVSTSLEYPLKFPEIDLGKPRLRWGDSFATDLSSLYVMDVMGVDYVDSSYLGGVPERVASGLQDVDLSFMMRFNPQAYEGVDRSLLGDWYKSFIELGIEPYGRQDWHEAAKAMKLLRDEK